MPAAVREIARGRRVCLAWENEDALTFEVGTGPDRCFVKWAPAGSPLDLAAEAARMTWALAYTPVPRVLGLDADSEGSWLVTTALPGHSAVSPRWLADPRTAVTAIGEGLRAMHDALPVTGCPFSWSAQDRIAAAQRAAAAGRLDTSDWAPEHLELGIEGALAQAQDIPPDDKVVVCHGDACAPNTLIAGDGRWVRPRRSRRPRSRGPVGRPGHRHLEHRLELRTRLGAGAARCLRDQAGRRTHPLLPAALGTRLDARRP